MQMPEPDPAILARKAEIVRRLQAVLAPDAVIHDPAEVRAYECDAFTAYRCPPLAVVLPASTAEVAAVLRVCHAEGVPVVPRGAGTSLAGGLAADRRLRAARGRADDRGCWRSTSRTASSGCRPGAPT